MDAMLWGSEALRIVDPNGTIEPARANSGNVSMGADAVIVWPPLKRLFVQ